MDKEINRRKEELITELPKISRKTVMDVLSEIEDEPNDFLDLAMMKMLEENNKLGELIIKSSDFSPIPEYALFNASAIYECFSREFNKQGQEIIKVSEGVISTYGREVFQEAIREISDFIKSGEEEGKEKVLKAFMKKRRGLLEEILDDNPELDPLLVTLIQTEVDLVRSGEPLVICVQWAFVTYELLKAQAEANRLKSLMEV